MRTPLFAAAAVLLLTACQPTASEETTTDAAAAPTGPARPAAAGEAPPPAFIGRWAAESGWCDNTLGPERPIEVTATEFRGYENTCQISDLATIEAGWSATFTCQAEGVTTSQPVQIEANAERLKLTWQDDGYDVEWRRCAA